VTFLCFSQSDFSKEENFHVKKKKTLREAKLTTPNIGNAVRPCKKTTVLPVFRERIKNSFDEMIIMC